MNRPRHMNENTQRFVDQARRIAHDKDAPPEEIEQKTADLIQANFPRSEFRDGECILMNEFERRFKRAFCKGIEPHYHQWPVRVDVDQKGITLRLGKTLDQIKKELNEDSQARASRLTPHD